MNSETGTQKRAFLLRTCRAPYHSGRAPIRYIHHWGGTVQAHRGPCRPHARCQPLLSLKNPRSVVLLCNQYTGVTKQTRNLFQWHARQEVLDRKRVSQHVKVGWPGVAISLQKELGVCLGSLVQNLPKDFDPIRNFALSFTATTPKQIARMYRRWPVRCVGLLLRRVAASHRRQNLLCT